MLKVLIILLSALIISYLITTGICAIFLWLIPGIDLGISIWRAGGVVWLVIILLKGISG